MRILLLGNQGQLGWELQRCMAPLGELMAMDYPDVDFTHPETLKAVVREVRPQILVNAVAYTAVDRAEREPEVANLLNAIGSGVLAEECRQIGALMVHYSTDYVFDGMKGSPYTEADPPKPQGVYAKTKLDGEKRIMSAGCVWFILRTSWLYSLRRENFVLKVLEWARNKTVLRVAADLFGSPTWARQLAELTAQMLAQSRGELDWLQEHSGLFHLAGDGAASRFDLAKTVLNYDPHPEEWRMEELQPALAAEFPAPGFRPMNSSLNCDRFEQVFGLRLPGWQEAVRLCLAEL